MGILLCNLLFAGVVFTAGETEIVADTNQFAFAAQELKELLGEAFGAEIPVVGKATGAKKSIALEFDAAFERDQIRLVTTKDGVRIVNGEAKVYGVYEFLERYAGMRFYFPGPLGTIVPKRTSLAVPEGTVDVKPDYTQRSCDMSWGLNGPWYSLKHDGEADRTEAGQLRALAAARMRLAPRLMCCHGLEMGFHFLKNYGKDHPEYFALLKAPDGTVYRDNSADSKWGGHHGQLCHTSGVWDEVYRLAVERLKAGEKTIDVMAQDGMQKCLCDKCQAAYSKDPDDRQWATDLIWGRTIELANRLTADGIGGAVTQMAYSPYNRIPDMEFPSNVLVMVAVNGAWSMANPERLARESGQVRAWAEKMGHKVWIWNYTGKFGTKIRNPDIPPMTPRAIGRYYASLSDAIFGSYMESRTDRWIYNYLNFYVYNKVSWNTKVDVDALLDEHYRLMFGAASAEMAEFFGRFENLWMDGIMGRGLLIETPMGPVAQPPTNEVIWNEIYSERTLVAIDALLCAAASKVPAGSLEARRIALFRREYLEPCVAAGAKYRAEAKETAAAKIELKEPGAKASVKLHSLYLGRRALKANVVGTTVEASRTADALVFRFICEEPETGDLASSVRPRDDKDIWKDDVVEICLETVRDGTYYHLFLNSKGSYADCHESHKNMPVKGYEWNLEGVKTSVEVGSGSWTGTFEMPLASLKGLGDEFRINFARERHLKHTSQYDMEYLYQWAPHAIGFGDTDNMGRIILK